MLQEIVLASSSPRRTELLRMIGVPHRVYSIPIDETFLENDSVPNNVMHLAEKKAFAVAQREASAYVIGADTVVVYDNQIFGKPGDDSTAIAMLQTLQGRVHEVFSGVAVVASNSLQIHTGYRRVEVKMRELSLTEIQHYVHTKEPFDKAGAYAIQGVGAQFIEWIRGDYYAVVGLPIELTTRLLRASGYQV